MFSHRNHIIYKLKFGSMIVKEGRLAGYKILDKFAFIKF